MNRTFGDCKESVTCQAGGPVPLKLVTLSHTNSALIHGVFDHV